MKVYSAAEQEVVLQSQLYTLDKSFANTMGMLKAVADILPGVLLVNDMGKLENTYMNQTGLQHLRRTQEELTGMGAEYFSEEIFCADEMAWIAGRFADIAQRDDKSEVVAFYQKVRPNSTHDWSHFQLSGKLMENHPGHVVLMSVATDQANYTLNRINKALDTEPIDIPLFQRFSTLTKREKQVLGLIAKGHTNVYISEALFLAQYTVETHRRNINKKLATKNIRELIRVAERFGL
ncbi:response regulator transcription factor [Mucilaginibacter myungsuensis]|uniref:Helix-turn-helix transcriptional regulator n=1 Tax=Mucilaginibacter myungsuensis TaxID=649104 RepID=A0A929L0Z9_9SPHI|nr:helix-turn-helix transcriptional regulator [Mucilaginibacter myungsuensis]MBE9664138.1 helix-turn-helix transcriptional regulator [Mucilaginibacter myungsuensis]MDN3601317.1 helix-turn-helix transcriptional regulator [Mucilaginibacter myungsuensis]